MYIHYCTFALLHKRMQLYSCVHVFHALTYVYIPTVYRLRNEMKNLMKKPDGGISVSLPDDSNVFLWKAEIVAPRKSLYEGIVYRMQY